ncbi:MAG: insulinase family protein, partial [Bacteroidales bacterium]
MQIEFEICVLDNGLKLIVHQDKTTPMIAVNVLYNIGSKDENKEHTGIAHLFEHLMFSGS